MAASVCRSLPRHGCECEARNQGFLVVSRAAGNPVVRHTYAGVGGWPIFGGVRGRGRTIWQGARSEWRDSRKGRTWHFNNALICDATHVKLQRRVDEDEFPCWLCALGHCRN